MPLAADHRAAPATHAGEATAGAQERTSEPKIGVAEFLSIAERFGFSDGAMARLRSAVSNADLADGGPHLGRYYGTAEPSMGDRLEACAREVFGIKHAVAVCNGTCALQAALAAAGVGPGDEIIVPALGFIATAMAGAVLGATVVYCDVDASLQMDPKKLDALITQRTAAVLPTHHWGFVCDMDPVLAIARRRGLKVIEDCAQSPGASYRGRPVGSLGDVGCFSISSYKIVGGGEGGLAVTNDDRLFDRVRQAAESGGLWRPVRFAPPRYEGELFVGGNFRLSELESAVSLVQLRKLSTVVSRYRRAWSRIRGQLGRFAEIQWQQSNDPEGDIGYMLRFFPRDHALGQTIARALRAQGFDARYRGPGAEPDWHVCRYHYPILGESGAHGLAETCPVAADLYDRCITLEINQWWSDVDADAFAKGINGILRSCCTPTDR